MTINKTTQAETKSREELEQEWQDLTRRASEIAQQLQPAEPEKPTAEERQWQTAMKKAMRLDRKVNPTIDAISKHLESSLGNDTDRELLAYLRTLECGVILSMYAPRHLVASDLTSPHIMDFYIQSARDAETLLKASKAKATGKQTGKGLKNENQAVGVANGNGK